MGIHADRLVAEGVAQKDVGGLSPNSRKRQEVVQLFWDSAVEALDDFLAAVFDQPALVAVEIDPVDVFLDLLQRRGGVVFGSAILIEKRGRDLIHQIIPGLCRQDQGHQEFQRARKVEVELGVGVSAIELVDDLSHSGLVARGFALFWLGSCHIVFAGKYDTSKSEMSKGGTSKWS